MTNREIDKLIAERIMKWKVIDDYDDLSSSPDQWNIAREYWSPSDDMAAAWQVIEKMRAKGLKVSIVISELSVVEISGWTFEETHSRWVEAESENKNTALAICKASLRAIGVEIEAVR